MSARFTQSTDLRTDTYSCGSALLFLVTVSLSLWCLIGLTVLWVLR